MRDSSRKTVDFSAKRGLKNAWFVHANLETLPEELQGFASGITILLPWGSLLRAVAEPDIGLLQSLARLCRPKAHIQIVFGYDHHSEQKVMEDLNLPEINEEYLHKLGQSYQGAGFQVRCKIVGQTDIKNIPATWAKKLAYGKPRRFVEISGSLTKTI